MRSVGASAANRRGPALQTRPAKQRIVEVPPIYEVCEEQRQCEELQKELVQMQQSKACIKASNGGLMKELLAMNVSTEAELYEAQKSFQDEKATAIKVNAEESHLRSTQDAATERAKEAMNKAEAEAQNIAGQKDAAEFLLAMRDSIAMECTAQMGKIREDTREVSKSADKHENGIATLAEKKRLQELDRTGLEKQLQGKKQELASQQQLLSKRQKEVEDLQQKIDSLRRLKEA